jgi:hypothetical protein
MKTRLSVSWMGEVRVVRAEGLKMMVLSPDCWMK